MPSQITSVKEPLTVPVLPCASKPLTLKPTQPTMSYSAVRAGFRDRLVDRKQEHVVQPLGHCVLDMRVVELRRWHGGVRPDRHVLIEAVQDPISHGRAADAAIVVEVKVDQAKRAGGVAGPGLVRWARSISVSSPKHGTGFPFERRSSAWGA